MRIRQFGTLIGAAMLTVTACKREKEFDPVGDFKIFVDRYKVAFENAFLEHPNTGSGYTFQWHIDPNVEKTDSLTKPWYADGVEVQIHHSKLWPEDEEVSLRPVVELGWFYSNNDSKWHLSKADNAYTFGNYADPTNMKRVFPCVIATELSTTMEGQ